MPTLQDTMNKCLLLTCLLLLSTSSQAFAPQCCQDGEYYTDNTRNCTNDTQIQLYCDNGMFMYNPEEEPDQGFHFWLDSNNVSWLIFEGLVPYNVSPNEYCMTRTAKAENLMLICFPEQTLETRPLWHTIFFGMFSMISTIFLALTLLVYLVLPELREVQDKAMICMTVSFMFAFFFTGNQMLNSWAFKGDTICILVAFIMYYAYMCAFFWLNVISLNIWRSVWFPSYKLNNDMLFTFYCSIGWGLPVCFLALSMFGHHAQGHYLVKPGFGETSCWFSDKVATWTYFYGPIMALLLINLFYLALTGWKLWHQYRDLSCCKLKVLKVKCMMCIKLALLMGITWIFEVISYATGDNYNYYWILPDILNAMQGFLIFLIMVVCRKRVRKLLAQRKPFNIPFPKSWAAYADVENCGPVGPEELELSQSS